MTKQHFQTKTDQIFDNETINYSVYYQDGITSVFPSYNSCFCAGEVGGRQGRHDCTGWTLRYRWKFGGAWHDWDPSRRMLISCNIYEHSPTSSGRPSTGLSETSNPDLSTDALALIRFYYDQTSASFDLTLIARNSTARQWFVSKALDPGDQHSN